MPELWQSYGSQADPVPKTVAVYSNQKTKACSLQRISLLSPSQEVLLTRRCVRACVCVCAQLTRTEALLLQRGMPCSCPVGSRTGMYW